jgi:hypothetical protein
LEHGIPQRLKDGNALSPTLSRDAKTASQAREWLCLATGFDRLTHRPQARELALFTVHSSLFTAYCSLPYVD